VTVVNGETFGTVGALAAFPHRLVARAVEQRGGRLARGVSRRTSHVVFGRNLLSKATDREIAARVAAERKAGRRLLSENGFLRLLGLARPPESPVLGRQSLIDQSGLASDSFDLLALFDTFENDAEPFSFRDLILARKYASLIAEGASWGTIARSVHRSGAVASLTAKSLHAEKSAAIYARCGEGLSELNGQLLFDLGSSEDAVLERIFADAEVAEQAAEFDEAAALYRRCLAIDPRDSVAAFNRANCLRAVGREIDAAHDYARALKLDASFVEAWFNLAGLMTDRGRIDSARRHLKKAIALDPAYADAIFNLAKLEFDAGHFAEARRWWARYLELDSASEWARTAARGMQFVDLQFAQKSAG
jgi:tetratricopeptide (TPR) repeat protein